MATGGRTFRLFVSSTFSDLKAERNALQAHVFPRLRRLCLHRDCRFQDIDLRWGISQEAGLDQRTMRICLQEVARCQETTPRPNFVVLLGDRYGWRPLPSEVPVLDFEAIRASAAASEQGLLTRWYRLDTNAVPPAWRLEPRLPGSPEAACQAWHDSVEIPLLGLFARINPRFGVSATEHEIAAGALAAGRDQHVFAFFRQITGFPDSGAGEFRDLSPDGTPDQDAALRLNHLKERLGARLGSMIQRYQSRWMGAGSSRPADQACDSVLEELLRVMMDLHGTEPEWEAISARQQALLAGTRGEGSAGSGDGSPISLGHLPALCTDLFLRLGWIMLQEISAFSALDPVDRDRRDHAEFGANRTRDFVGRREALDALRAYLRAPASSGKPPLAVVGDSGSGKTALLGFAAGEAALVEGTRVVVRFVGATPESTDGRSLLLGLTREVARYYGASEAAIPEDFRSLKNQLPDRLAVASADRPLAVFVDAVDMLAPTDRAPALGWLPRTLPPHVSFILSTTPGESEQAARRRVGPRVVPLDQLSLYEGSRLLHRWLDRAGRTLTRDQRRAVLEGFARNRTPLYLKLAFETVREWPSFLEPPQFPPQVADLIGSLFDRLSAEENHGPLLVSRSLAWLAAARHGLTEDEILDLLSRDAAVMGSFRERSPDSPQVARLPVVVWSRLYHDLQSYLSRQHADGTIVLSYYHQQVKQTAKARYLGVDARTDRHGEVASYFEDDARLSVDAGDRQVFNLRKLAEQPYQQTEAGRWNQLTATLSDLQFLQAKVQAGLGLDTVTDYERARSAFPAADDTILRELATAFNQEAAAFLPNPESTAQQIYHSLFAQEGLDGPAGSVLRAFSGLPSGWCRRINRSPRTSIPRSLLRTIAAHQADVTALALSPDGVWIAAGDRLGSIRVFHGSDGAEVAVLQHDGGAIDGLTWVTSNSGPPRLVSIGQIEDRSRLAVWDWEGERLETAVELPVRIRSMASEGAVCFLGGDDYLVTRWKPDSTRPEKLYGHQDRVYSVAVSAGAVLSGSADRSVRLALDGSVTPLKGHERPVRAVALSPTGALGVTGDDAGQLRVWNIPGRREQRVIQAHTNRVNAVGVLEASGEILSGCADGAIKSWDAGTGRQRRTLHAHTRAVTCIVTDPGRARFASAGEDHTVRLWELDPNRREAIESNEHDGAITALAMLPNGEIASASEDHTIRLWSFSGECQHVLRGHLGPVTCLLASGDRLISGSSDRTVRRWKLDRSGQVEIWGDPAGAALARTPELRDLSGHARPVRALLLTREDHILSAGEDGHLRGWPGPGPEYQAVPGGLTTVVALDRWIAGGGTPTEVVVWPRDGGNIQTRLAGHTSSVTCLAGLNGERIVSASLDGSVRVWSPATGAGRVRWKHPARVNVLIADSERSRIASGAEDGTVTLGDPDGNDARALQGHSAPVRVLAMAAGILFSGDDAGRVRLWNVEAGAPRGTVSLGSAVSALLPDRDRLWVGTRSGTVALFQLEGGTS